MIAIKVMVGNVTEKWTNLCCLLIRIHFKSRKLDKNTQQMITMIIFMFAKFSRIKIDIYYYTLG